MPDIAYRLPQRVNTIDEQRIVAAICQRHGEKIGATGNPRASVIRHARMLVRVDQWCIGDRPPRQTRRVGATHHFLVFHNGGFHPPYGLWP